MKIFTSDEVSLKDAGNVAQDLSCDDTVDDLDEFLPGRSFPTRKIIFA